MPFAFMLFFMGLEHVSFCSVLDHRVHSENCGGKSSNQFICFKT